MKKINLFLNFKTLAIIAISFIILALVTITYILNYSEELVKEMGKQDAILQVKALSHFRTFYTKEVIVKAKNFGLKISHDFQGKKKTLPLPASMTKLLGAKIGEDGDGSKAFLYSAHPFPWRKEGGLNDSFRKEAWAFLTKHPTQSFSRIEFIGGKKILRFAKADLMRQACIKCHNTHPDTPRKNWKRGDVRGILEVHKPLLVSEVGTIKKATTITFLVFSMSGLGVFLSILMAVVIKRDRENQALLLHSSKLATLGEMAGGVAHEINNPLGIISMNIGNLKKMFEKNILSEENFNEITQDIDQTINRISKIITSLRIVSRDSAEYSAQEVQIKHIIEDIQGVCSEKFKSKEITFDLINHSKRKTLYCDRVQISQVLINLVGNSFDAIKILDNKLIKIEITEDAQKILIRVSDSGKGIPLKIQAKMFNPFFTSKDIGEGTGLGLSISRGIMKEHGGQLVFDKIAPYTSFTLSFPRK